MSTNPPARPLSPTAVDTVWQQMTRSEERARLLRFCLHLTGGDRDSAEDIAQETLYEAWRKREIVAGARAWRPLLRGIAQNVHHRWRRRAYREFSRRIPVTAEENASSLLENLPDSAPSFDTGMERADMAALVAQALSHLTPTNRTILEAFYCGEESQAEIAARLGMTENTTAVRIHRARESLRRVLTTGELRQEAAAHGLLSEDDPALRWVETRLWCPMCGARQMQGRRGSASEGIPFSISCPGCGYAVGPSPLGNRFSACFFRHQDFRPEEALGDVTAFKPALHRLHSWWYDLLRTGVERGRMRCLGCGRDTPLLPTPPESPLYAYPTRGWIGVHAPCLHCGHVHVLPPSGFAVAAPPVRQFWKENPRIRLLPVHRLPGNSRNAFVSGFESVTGSARIEVVLAGDTFEVLETLHS